MRKLLVVCLLLALAAGAAGLAAGPAAAKDFSITSIAVDAQVISNGDLSITDTPHARLLRHLPLRLLGPRHQGLRRHRRARRQRPRRAAPRRTTVPYQFSEYAIVGSSSARPSTYGVGRPQLDAVRVQLNFEVTDATAHLHRAVRRQGRRQAVHRHGAAVLAVRRRRHGGRVAQRERHRAPAGRA